MLDTAVFVVQKLLGGSQLLFSATMLPTYFFFLLQQTFWKFFLILLQYMPRLTLPNNSLSTKFATPRFAARTSFTAHEFSTTRFAACNSYSAHVLCQIPLFITRQSTLFLLVYTYMLRKSSSLILLWGFLPSCSECRLRSFSLFFPRKDLFEAGTSHAEDKKRTTQLCCRWLSNSRTHSPCIQTTLLDGNQLLFSVTNLIFLSSSTIAQVNVLEVFFEIKI